MKMQLGAILHSPLSVLNIRHSSACSSFSRPSATRSVFRCWRAAIIEVQCRSLPTRTIKPIVCRHCRWSAGRGVPMGPVRPREQAAAEPLVHSYSAVWAPGVGQLHPAVLIGLRGCKQHGPSKEAPAAIAGLVFVHVKTRAANMSALTFRSLNKREEHKSWSR